MSAAAKNGRRGRAADAPRLDAANLAGITSLMNTQHLKPGVDLDRAEKAVMGKSTAPTRGSKSVDPVHLYAAEMNQLADELGIDLLGDDGPVMKARAPSLAPARVGGAARTATAKPDRFSTDRFASLVDKIDFEDAPASRRPEAPSSKRPETPSSRRPEAASARRPEARPPVRRREASSSSDEDSSDDGSYDDDSDDSYDSSDGSYDSSDESGEYCDCDSEETCSSRCSCGCHEESESSGSADNERVDDIISGLEADLGIDTGRKSHRRAGRVRDIDVPHVERRDRGGAHITDEQERRRHINSVMSDLRGETRTTFGVERERIQDIKASKLEQIGQLRMTLDEEGIDCTGVTVPTPDSPMEEIDSVLNILRLKNDRNRYSSLAEEIILGFAEGIETVFDGTRQVPLVGWTPDYTGYHNTVNVKLHRMRGETSMVVGRIIEKYNVGPTSRIIMELLPSFFLYPRQQKKQRGIPGLASDPRVSDARGAMSAIREANGRNEANALLNV